MNSAATREIRHQTQAVRVHAPRAARWLTRAVKLVRAWPPLARAVRPSVRTCRGLARTNMAALNGVQGGLSAGLVGGLVVGRHFFFSRVRRVKIDCEGDVHILRIDLMSSSDISLFCVFDTSLRNKKMMIITVLMMRRRKQGIIITVLGEFSLSKSFFFSKTLACVLRVFASFSTRLRRHAAALLVSA